MYKRSKSQSSIATLKIDCKFDRHTQRAIDMNVVQYVFYECI